MPKQDRSKLRDFTLFPVLGRRTDVPQNHPSLFEQVGETAFKTHDVGGINFDTERQVGACSKAFGYKKWSAGANSKAAGCLGLYELYDGTNRDYISFDEGRFFTYDSDLYPNEMVLNFDAGTDAFVAGETATDDGGNSPSGTIRTVAVSAGAWATNDAVGTLVLYDVGTGAFTDDAALTSATGAATVKETGDLTPITFASDDTDIYSIIKVGDYVVFADRAEHTPYRWINGDDYLTKLIQSGTEYKFRYLEVFQRRIFGLYSDQTNAKIDIRYSTAWPATAFTSLNYPAANQLYVPNDDTITGGRKMGQDRLYVYCENSIHQIVHYPDYVTPFKIYTVVPDQGATCHHSIVSLGDRHFLFNKDYGFCEYRGASEFPYGGKAISDPIKGDIRNISNTVYDLIVGHFVPLTNEIVWTVPCEGASTPNRLFFYNIITKQWRVEDKEMRYPSSWRLYSTYTWANLIAALDQDADSTAYWKDAGPNTWSDYVGAGMGERLVYANTDGHLYYQGGDDFNGLDYDGVRVEPILDFGDSYRKDILAEIWFDSPQHGDFSIRVDHRKGNTVGELVRAGWETRGNINLNSPDRAMVKVNKTARLHQIRWGNISKERIFPGE